MQWLIDSLVRARNSTLKRLKNLTEEQMDFHGQDRVSIRDIAWHIAQCDNVMIKAFIPETEIDDRLYPDMTNGKSKTEVLDLLNDKLSKKCDILSLNMNKLTDKTNHISYGNITIGEVVICAGIDHEAHHRGQIALICKDNKI